jgi:ribonuclease HI
MLDVLQDKSMNKQVQSRDLFSQGKKEKKTQIQKQGSTINSVLHIAGSKIFTDAACKTRKMPGLASGVATGVGVYCQIQEEGTNAEIMIQASIPNTTSVLQAESEALLVAARIASALNLRHLSFLTDNSTLASAAASQETTIQHIPWEIRRHIADYRSLTASSDVAIYHISRNLNEVAHKCAHQALRHYMSKPILSCTSSAHRYENCPFLSAVSQIQSTGLVLIAVNCL